MSASPRHALLGLASVALALVAGCADVPQFEGRFPPSFSPKTRSIAPVGVYRDGRLDPDAWDRLGLGAALPGSCPPAFGEALRGADPDTFAALDDEARANGISEDLLGRLATKAKSDSMLLVTVHGRAQGPTKVGAGPHGQRRATPPARGSQRGMVVPSGTPQDFASPGGDLEANAIFFSVARRERLGSLTMKYSGPDAEAAFDAFVKRLTELTDGAACGGWTTGKELPAAPLPPGGP